MFRIRVSLLAILTALIAVPVGAATGTQTAEQGMKMYTANKCSICHSIAGQGNKKLPLDGVGAKLTADQIREWIVNPAEAAKKATSKAKPPMKAYPNLATADLDALVAYLKSLDKK